MRAIQGAIAASLIASSVLAAAAQPYPAKAVRIVTGGVGTFHDIVTRQLGQALSERWRQPVVVDNQPAAALTVGTGMVARAMPDGYTLAITDRSALAVAPHLLKSVPYDPTKDFAPITEAAAGALVLVVKPSLPVKSLQDLIALAKKEPGKLNAGLSALGSMHHLTTEVIKSQTGVRWTNVPYKGSAPMLNDLLGGQIDFGFDNIPSALPHIQSGKLRAIAVSGPTRTDLLPDVPTLQEAGMKGVEALAWHGVLAPANTPAPIVKRLHDEIVKLLQAPDMKKRLNGLGLEPVGNSPAEFQKFIVDENVKWAKIAKDAGAKLE